MSSPIVPRRTERSIGGEVPCSIPLDLISLVEMKGGDIGPLLDDADILPETLTDPTAAISWESFRQLCLTVTRDWSEAEAVEVGRRIYRLGSAQPYMDMALFLRNPIECYRQAVGPERFHYIDCMDQTLEEIDRDNVRITTTMHEGYEPFSKYFQVRKGVLEMLPTLIGFPSARVELTPTARGAIFEVRIVRPRGLLGRMRVWSQRIRGSFVPRERILALFQTLAERNEVARNRIEMLDERLEDLRRSEELFTHSFRAAPVSMLINRVRDHKIIDVNEKFVESTGFSRDEIMNWKSPGEKIWASAEDRKRAIAAIAQPGKPVDDTEIQMRHRGGRRGVILLSAKIVNLAGESCVLWQGIDITDRKRTEDELAMHREHLESLVEERTRELERSTESLQRAEHLASVGTLAAGIAHQINNPVGVIQAASEFALLCEDQPDTLDQYRDALETCQDQAQRCGRIVGNILRFSRGEEGERAPEELRNLVNHSCTLVGPYARERGAEIEVDEGDGEIPVIVNAIEIEQVLVNVLRNAIEAGEEKLHIKVHTVRLDSFAMIEIRDDGPGIAKEQIPFLFDPFYTTRLRHGGTGLGLSVAHGIVTAHGGEIRVDPEHQDGTSIQIRLPIDVRVDC